MNKEVLLDKWLNGEITPKEMEALKALPEFSTYAKIDVYLKNMELPVHDHAAGMRDLKERMQAKPSTPKIFRLSNMLKIAAILTLLAASYFYVSSLPTTINTDIAQTHTLQLPDASEVILNENSSLKFKEKNWEDNRAMSLEGEAFFSVSKGSSFDVTTPKGKITVLGTQFNILSRNNVFEVTCFDGLVAVMYKDQVLKLSKGASAILVDETLVSGSVFTSKPRWIYNESSYNDVLFSHVVDALEDQYKVSVTTQNINVNLRYTGTFTHEDLDAALQTITIPLDLKYRIGKENVVTIYAEQSPN